MVKVYNFMGDSWSENHLTGDRWTNRPSENQTNPRWLRIGSAIINVKNFTKVKINIFQI